LYLHLHDLGKVHPSSGTGGAWCDRKRVCRNATDARQHETPVLMPTACQGLVTWICSIAPARVPARWISFTLRRRLNQEKNFIIATDPPFDMGSVTTLSDAARRQLAQTVVRAALSGNRSLIACDRGQPKSRRHGAGGGRQIRGNTNARQVLQINLQSLERTGSH
jgi:hypothetical protein